MLIKVKWLPFLCIAGGIYGLISETWDPMLSVIFIIGGGIGAFFMYSGKPKAKSNEALQNDNKPNYYEPSKVQPMQSSVINPNTCSNCSADLESGMAFCTKCGTKNK